jgi:hypothetical protein
MNFQLTPEPETLQRGAIEFAHRQLNSNMIARDAQQVFSYGGRKKFATFGGQ